MAQASEIRSALTGFPGEVRQEVPLAPMTHVRIGGPAAFLLAPKTAQGVCQAVELARSLAVPLQVIGGGSNLLVGDAGVSGLTLSLANLNRVTRDGERITAEAGASLPALIRSTKDLGLAGLELLIGIPAQVGGAVAMNAGTRDTDTFTHLHSLKVVDEHGVLQELERDAMRPRYRDGGLGASIVVEATFALTPDDPRAIFDRLETSLKRRNATQPVSERSVGCVFRNPDGVAAAQLIEDAGCKMLSRGAVRVSGKHANYF
ncbi:MAG: FAD-binding protein, partial [Planctomycetes bacterium]|nr:FAD-binding protein [Planctomycetota bacterium]